MRSRKILIITLVAAASLLLTGSLLKNQSKPIEVKTTEVTRGEISSYLSTSGKIKSQTTEQYFGTPQLTVKRINAKIGDPVKKGEVLVEFNTEDLAASYKQAQAQYNNAVLQKKEAVNQQKQANASVAKLDSQINTLKKQDYVDELVLQQLTQRRDTLQPVSTEKIKMLENSILTSRQNLDSISKKYTNAKKGVVSEIDGVLTHLNANEGAVLSPSAPAAVVEDLNNLKVTIALGKYDIAKVKTGQQVVINNIGQQHYGTINYISPTAEAAASSLKAVQTNAGDAALTAEAEIDNPGSDLKVGFDVDTSILIAKAEDIIKIPTEAVRNDKVSGTYVMLAQNNKAVQRNIRTGIQSDTEIQVLEGLDEGEIIILSPVENVKNGTPVRIPGGKNDKG